jgi:23S rRNA (pseudouridine1915-N3)-methyltransferase
VFVIGGAYGVTDEVKRRADYVWSFSRLVFPHELVRLLLSEQLYRAYDLIHGGKYHHD